MKFLIILGLLLPIAFVVSGQNFSQHQLNQIDSLNEIIINKSSLDTSLAVAYVRMSDIFSVSNRDTVVYLSEMAKGIAEKALLVPSNSIVTKVLSASLAASLYNIGTIALLNGNYNRSLVCLKRSLNIREEIKDHYGMAISLKIIGNLYLEQGQYKQAEKYATRSLQLATELKFQKNINTTSELLYRIFRKTGKYEKALAIYERYISLRDSIANEETEKTALKHKIQFEYEKKAAADSVARAKENEIQDTLFQAQKAELNSKRNLQYGLMGGFVLVALFAGFMFSRYKLARRQKSLMEIKKEEANKQRKIATQNNTLALEQQSIAEENSTIAEIQTEKAEMQMHTAMKLKNHLFEKNREITSSIEYAANIQAAILTSETYWNKMLNNYFVLFMPKDIVSGDFYWAYETQSGKKIWITADCTGHGVPGGFMSMLGNTMLNEIIIENKVESPNEILNILRLEIIKGLSHDFSLEKRVELKDGMDMALCILHEDGTLEYSGAYNPLWITSKSEKNPRQVENSDGIEDNYIVIEPTPNENYNVFLHEIKADRMPIGKFAELTPFKSHKLILQPGDTIYTFTDGYIDQFGGEKAKKFKSKSFKALLLSMQSQPIAAQKYLLRDAFNEWRGINEQVDDVCVIGVKV